MPSITSRSGTRINGATNHTNATEISINTNVSTDELLPGGLYSIDASTGPVTVTVNTAPAGTEYHFFVTNLTNSVDFAAGSASIWAPNNAYSVNRLYTHITVKFVQSGGRAALIPSDPLV